LSEVSRRDSLLQRIAGTTPRSCSADRYGVSRTTLYKVRQSDDGPAHQATERINELRLFFGHGVLMVGRLQQGKTWRLALFNKSAEKTKEDTKLK